jgi:hypothetical protein
MNFSATKVHPGLHTITLAPMVFAAGAGLCFRLSPSSLALFFRVADASSFRNKIRRLILRRLPIAGADP